ncbi:MAG: hypothetical protein V2A34_01240 [Lentisphaerota bacterium]
MNNRFEPFAVAAKDLARNPLGIIALFILLVYGFACLILGISGHNLTPDERCPLVWFLVLFPPFVLIAFCWLVANHHQKLYAPGDFRTDDNFLRTHGSSMPTSQIATIANVDDAAELLKVGEGSIVVRQNEEAIKRDIENKNLDPSKREQVLVRHLAIAQAGLWFERTYYMIFGSQIQLLKRLNEIRQGVDHEYVASFFEAVKMQFQREFEKWSVEDYVRFLNLSNLIESTSTGYVITQAGSEFLVEIARRGLNEIKGL